MVSRAETTQGLLARILEPGSRADPYPLFEEAGRRGPLWVEGRPVVVLASHEDCRSVLRDPRASNDRSHALIHRDPSAPDGGTPGVPAELPSFLFMDPPRHTRLRRMASSAFTPRAVERLEDVIREIVDDLLDELQAGGRMDVIDGFASPLPVTVICRVLGAQTGDHGWYRRRSSRLGRSVDPYPALLGVPAPGREERAEFEAELHEFFAALMRERREDPRDDVMTALLSAEDDLGRLTEEEIVTTCRLLLNAGHETTVNLIGNGLLALLSEPGRIASLREDPSLADAVVEEVLRLDPPLQLVHRHAREDMDVRGVRIPRGTTMVLLLAGANRDGARFGEPDRFHPGRAGASDHLSFGQGVHFCLGAPLARLEGRLAFTRFAQRAVAPRLVGDRLDYRENVVLRGLSGLPVRVEGVLPRSTPWDC
ncbi:cytochrome P450 [Nocardiopsis tropica]|uniref:Cytochrome P450 n=1 Tax=Nocardiopsis tropica TaxID=109330 RepID=A0ABU7KIR1_9ACTN|nr:cytochrome P450 [Nocardiopsis umidischolae]MEE2049189.1 cytochrome P450 [Nocardiopsis umidischolae]